MTLESVKAKTKAEHPKVDQVEPSVVAAWMESDDKPLLLDVRENAEFAVSHLAGAEHADPGATAADLVGGALKDVPRDRRIVTYCSVGVRSTALADRLRQAGFTNVHNMAGSLFQWANEGRPVYRDDREVDKVHPYDEKWGRLLDAERRADVK